MTPEVAIVITYSRGKSTERLAVFVLGCLLAFVSSSAMTAERTSAEREDLFRALKNRSPLVQEWAPRAAILKALEGSYIRLSLLFIRCKPMPVVDRLLIPAYRKYVETIGSDYYNYVMGSLREGEGVSPEFYWAMKEISDDEYREGMSLLTDPSMQPARAMYDLLTETEGLIEQAFDLHIGMPDLGPLVMFKETLDNTGQTEYFARALDAVNAGMGERFRSLSFSLPVTPKKLAEWHELSQWIGRSDAPVAQIQEALAVQIPSAMLADIDRYQHSALIMRAAEAKLALKAWHSYRESNDGRDKQKFIQPPNDQERLGQRIAAIYAIAYPPRQDLISDGLLHLRKAMHDYLKVHKTEICTESVGD